MDNWDNNSSSDNITEVLNEIMSSETSNQMEVTSVSTSMGNHDVFSYSDPLKYSHLFEFAPLQLSMEDSHFVKPHYVDPYIRQDGTLVEGYYRDGDGDTSIDRPFGLGGGYIRSNPEGE